MVKPVVVVGDVVWLRLALHAAQGTLARVPEAVVRDGEILRVVLQVDGAVALGMVAAAVWSIEEVHVVNPYHGVLGVQRDAVVHAPHDCEVAELHARCVAHEESEAVNSSVVTHTFYGDVHGAVVVLAFYLQSLAGTRHSVQVRLLDESDEAECYRSSVLSLLIGVADGLYARTLANASHGGGYRLGSVCRDVEHLCSCLQCAVRVVRSYTGSTVLELRETAAVVVLYHDF